MVYELLTLICRLTSASFAALFGGMQRRGISSFPEDVNRAVGLLRAGIWLENRERDRKFGMRQRRAANSSLRLSQETPHFAGMTRKILLATRTSRPGKFFAK